MRSSQRLSKPQQVPEAQVIKLDGFRGTRSRKAPVVPTFRRRERLADIISITRGTEPGKQKSRNQQVTEAIAQVRKEYTKVVNELDKFDQSGQEANPIQKRELVVKALGLAENIMALYGGYSPMRYEDYGAWVRIVRDYRNELAKLVVSPLSEKSGWPQR